MRHHRTRSANLRNEEKAGYGPTLAQRSDTHGVPSRRADPERENQTAVKLRLFQELCDFNRAFEGVIAGLKRMEKNGYTLPETVREWRAEVLSIQIEVNREFFNEFEADLDRDEEWVCKVQRKHSR